MTDDAQPETEMPAEPAPQPSGDGGGRARVSPGHLLRSSRERQELSLDELTARTLLNRTTVEALENNEFERLSQPVFVRGYYRKCAKVLGIPEDEIMDAYAQWTGESGPRPASPGQVDVIPQDVTPQRWRAVGFALMVVLALVVAVLAWSWLPALVNGGDGEATGAATSVTAGTTVPPSSGDGDSEAEAEAAGEGGTADIDVSPAGPGEDAAADGASAAAAGGDSGAAPGDTRLVLRFNERSWVRVRDAGGAVLLDGTIGGGNLRVVEGDPPYEVALGYAPGVELSIGGRSVATAERTKADDTARLTVRAGGGSE